MIKKHYLRDLRVDALKLLEERGSWLIAAVETEIFWPKFAQVFPYGGTDLILRPGDDKLVPTIAFNFNKYNLTKEAARELILNFASALSWMEKSRLEISSWTGGGHAIQVIHGRTRNESRFLDPEMLEVPANEDESTALAFYREAVSTRNPFYAFLSFYKVIAFSHREGKERGRWIKAALDNLETGTAFDRLAALKTEVGDKVDEYLLNEGRHAIAHAEKEIFINPDKMGDRQRISSDLPLMRRLAELSIEKDHGFVTDLYAKKYAAPISGFREMIGDATIRKLLEVDFKPEDVIEVPDQVTFVARKEGSVAILPGMLFSELGIWESGISLAFEDKTETVHIQVDIDFRKNELHFDPLSEITVRSKRGNIDQIDAEIGGHEFVMAAFCNAPIEIWNDNGDTLLGRAKGYIPLNMYADTESHLRLISELNTLRGPLTLSPSDMPGS